MKNKVNDKEGFKPRRGGGGWVSTPTAIEVKPKNIRYDFWIPAEKKDIFSDWINILSKPEFLITIHSIRYSKSVSAYLKNGWHCYISINGQQEDVDRWHSNMKLILGTYYTIKFVIPIEKRDTFTDWINTLSRPEFHIAIQSIVYTDHSKNRECCSIVVNGRQEDVDRWHSNVELIERSIGEEYNEELIKYFLENS